MEKPMANWLRILKGYAHWVLVALTMAPLAHADDGTWNTDAGAGNLNWSNTGNWLGGVVADGTGVCPSKANVVRPTLLYEWAAPSPRSLPFRRRPAELQPGAL